MDTLPGDQIRSIFITQKQQGVQLIRLQNMVNPSSSRHFFILLLALKILCFGQRAARFLGPNQCALSIFQGNLGVCLIISDNLG